MTDPSRTRRLATLADVLHRREPGTRYEVHYAVAEELLVALEREELATAGPRIWALPDEPGPEVRRLSAVGGDLRLERDPDDPRYWIVYGPRGNGIGYVTFDDALVKWSPLTEVPDEEAGT